MAEWHVSEGKKEVPETRGKSKNEATERFLFRQRMLFGYTQPWVWWEKQGFKLRRD